MTILQAKYRFIQDDVFLVPKVNTETGKQIVEMQKINDRGEVEFSDAIECIHTAITDISFDEFENFQIFPSEREEFFRKTLQIQSSEQLYEINLSPEEKFFALKSWTAGIAEAGKDAFKLETDIEIAGHLYYPMAGKLLLFMVRVDTDFIFEYVEQVEKMCMFEGVKHQSSLMANIYPILNLLYQDFAKPVIKDRVKVIRAMHSIVEFPIESVSRGAGGMIRYYLRDHPEYGVQYIKYVIERDYNRYYRENKQILFELIAPLLIVFIQERGPPYTKFDIEFVNTILELNPPALWLKKFKVFEVLEAIKRNKKFILQKRWFTRTIRIVNGEFELI